MVVAGLIRGLTVADAAEAAGVKRGTVHAWKRDDPGFNHLLREAEDDVSRRVIEDAVEGAVLQWKELAPLATERIREVLEGGDKKLWLTAAAQVWRNLGTTGVETQKVEDVLGSLDQSPSAGD